MRAKRHVRSLAALASVLLVALAQLCLPDSAFALEAIDLTTGQIRIDLTRQGAFYQRRGDQLQIETAPGLDGITERMAVRAKTPGTEPNWVVFALRNFTNEHIERWLVADRYSFNGSGIFTPDLDISRITAVTPSVGFKPERVERTRADIFRLSVEPGATITFVAELTPNRFPKLSLWDADAYQKKRRDVTLFNGILLGITGIMAIFLTAIFAANHKAVFPASAILAWSILSYLCIDFGFWHKLFNLTAEDNATYRAVAEASVAASFVFFLFVFLRIRLWHAWVRVGFAGWLVLQLSLVALAFVDERLAAGLARGSFGLIAVFGTLVILYLAARGQSRALSIIPTWLMFLVWLVGAGVTVIGALSGQIVISSLTAGLVLILALIGYTVTQFAFQNTEHLAGAPPSRLMMSNLAIEGAGASIWEWRARRNEVIISRDVEDALGLAWGSLNGGVEDWVKHMHPSDKERTQLVLRGVEEQGGGSIDIEFRMRRSDGTYLWFDLMADTVEGSQRRGHRCIGLMRDVTNEKRAQERLMHDAVNDSLTGLPNRELFVDRLARAVTRARTQDGVNPTILYVDIDRFKKVNASFGMGVGDTMLLTIARRLARYLDPRDTLARLGGDQFAILLVSMQDPAQIRPFTERMRQSIRAPMKISGKDIVLTGSVGIAHYDASYTDHTQLLRDAELAMYRAKQSGHDNMMVFEHTMRDVKDDRSILEADLRRAIKSRLLTLSYQPIVRCDRGELVGFEALLRWNHPQFGNINPEEFVRIAEERDMISELGGFVLNEAVKEAARWHKLMPATSEPLFVSVNVSSAQLFRKELLQDVKRIMAREEIPRGCLRLEITESLVMENPEQATDILVWLRSHGAGLSLDDFGTGYSSLAYLYRFPFDTIKVDKELVQASGTDQEAPVILRSIVALAHELGKNVIAEGVETDEEMNYLRSINCDYAQGFNYGEPMNSVEVHNLLVSLAKTGRTNVQVPQRASDKQTKVPATQPSGPGTPSQTPQSPPAPLTTHPVPVQGTPATTPNQRPPTTPIPPVHTAKINPPVAAVRTANGGAQGNHQTGPAPQVPSAQSGKATNRRRSGLAVAAAQVHGAAPAATLPLANTGTPVTSPVPANLQTAGQPENAGGTPPAGPAKNGPNSAVKTAVPRTRPVHRSS